MSSFAGYCKWCRKPVMHKTLFGTMHFCITDEEKAAIQAQRLAQRLPQTSRLEELVKNAMKGKP